MRRYKPHRFHLDYTDAREPFTKTEIACLCVMILGALVWFVGLCLEVLW